MSGTAYSADLLPLAKAAAVAGLSRSTLRGWHKAGGLPAVWREGQLWVDPADVAVAREVAHLGSVVPCWRVDPRRAGWRLRVLREAAGQTQLELAAATGLAHETISRLELGREAPYATTAQRLATALRVAPDVFVAPGELAATLSLGEAAARLGVPTARLRNWLNSGAFPGVKASGQWRVDPETVADLERSGRMRGRSRRLDPRFRS